MKTLANFETKINASAPTAREGFEEELAQILRHSFLQHKTSTSSVKKRAKDFSRYIIKIAAVVTLFLGGYLMLSYLSGSLYPLSGGNTSTSIPNPEAQIQLVSLVLPGGHTSPTASDGAQFNFDEVPADLHHLVYEQILSDSQDRPAITPQTPIRLTIPAIDVNHLIVQGVDWTALTMGIGQLTNGATPDDSDGNIVLVAHNDIYGEIFRDLDKLEPGIEFEIETETGTYTYVVTDWQIVEPDAVYVMESRGYPTATLISGYPYRMNTHRIVVFADRLIE